MAWQPEDYNIVSESTFLDNYLNHNDEPGTPPPVYDKVAGPPTLGEDILVSFLMPLFKRFGSRDRVIELLAQLSDQHDEMEIGFDKIWRQKKRAQIGPLSTPSLIRKEMAALYRESYAYGLEGSRYFTRLMYMLDCLQRAAQSERKHVQKPAECGRTDTVK